MHWQVPRFILPYGCIEEEITIVYNVSLLIQFVGKSTRILHGFLAETLLLGFGFKLIWKLRLFNYLEEIDGSIALDRLGRELSLGGRCYGTAQCGLTGTC